MAIAHRVKILDTGWDTHDVRRLTVEKPDGYEFVPGQATEVAIDKAGWREQLRPFTFTSLNAWPELEFHIKVYSDHDGVTKQIGLLENGDHLILDDPWGAITYQGEGYFIAGGAGVTPFIAILRDLSAKGQAAGNTLLFSNKTEGDIILRSEFSAIEGLDCVFTVTDQPDSDLAKGFIDSSFLKTHVSDFSKAFYVCGPPEMVEQISETLRSLGADPNSVVFEK